MNLDIKGNEDFSKFEIDSKIENENLKQKLNDENRKIIFISVYLSFYF